MTTHKCDFCHTEIIAAPGEVTAVISYLPCFHIMCQPCKGRRCRDLELVNCLVCGYNAFSGQIYDLEVPDQEKINCRFCSGEKETHGRVEFCCNLCENSLFCGQCAKRHRETNDHVMQLVKHELLPRSQCSSHSNVLAVAECSCNMRVCETCERAHERSGHTRRPYRFLAEVATKNLRQHLEQTRQDDMQLQKLQPIVARQREEVKMSASKARTAVASEIVELCNALMRRGNDIITAIDIAEQTKVKMLVRLELEMKSAREKLRKIDCIMESAMTPDLTAPIAAAAFAEGAYALFTKKGQQIQRGIETLRTSHFVYLSNLPHVLNAMNSFGQLNVDGQIRTPLQTTPQTARMFTVTSGASTTVANANNSSLSSSAANCIATSRLPLSCRSSTSSVSSSAPTAMNVANLPVSVSASTVQVPLSSVVSSSCVYPNMANRLTASSSNRVPNIPPVCVSSAIPQQNGVLSGSSQFLPPNSANPFLNGAVPMQPQHYMQQQQQAAAHQMAMQRVGFANMPHGSPPNRLLIPTTAGPSMMPNAAMAAAAQQQQQRQQQQHLLAAGQLRASQQPQQQQQHIPPQQQQQHAQAMAAAAAVSGHQNAVAQQFFLQQQMLLQRQKQMQQQNNNINNNNTASASQMSPTFLAGSPPGALQRLGANGGADVMARLSDEAVRNNPVLAAQLQNQHPQLQMQQNSLQQQQQMHLYQQQQKQIQHSQRILAEQQQQQQKQHQQQTRIRIYDNDSIAKDLQGSILTDLLLTNGSVVSANTMAQGSSDTVKTNVVLSRSSSSLSPDSSVQISMAGMANGTTSVADNNVGRLKRSASVIHGNEHNSAAPTTSVTQPPLAKRANLDALVRVEENATAPLNHNPADIPTNSPSITTTNSERASNGDETNGLKHSTSSNSSVSASSSITRQSSHGASTSTSSAVGISPTSLAPKIVLKKKKTDGTYAADFVGETEDVKPNMTALRKSVGFDNDDKSHQNNKKTNSDSASTAFHFPNNVNHCNGTSLKNNDSLYQDATSNSERSEVTGSLLDSNGMIMDNELNNHVSSAGTSANINNCLGANGDKKSAENLEKNGSCPSSSKDRWDDYCYVCNQGYDDDMGLLGCCDGCPHVYHNKCHVPAIRDLMEDLPDPWYCTLCSSHKILREWSSTFGEDEKILCSKVLLSCFAKQPDVQAFYTEVSRSVTQYYEIIKNPICLYDIAQKLSDNPVYKRVEEFIDDMNLLFQNCSLFNSPSHSVAISGRALYEIYRSSVCKYMPAYEKHVWVYTSLRKQSSRSRYGSMGSSNASRQRRGGSLVQMKRKKLEASINKITAT